MVLYPEVQKKAQEDLARVVGSSRLPTFEDRKDLPYITAIAKETLRWHTVAPQGTRGTAVHLSLNSDAAIIQLFHIS